MSTETGHAEPTNLTAEVKEFIRDHVAESAPNEACGFVATKSGVQQAFRSRNDEKEDPRRGFVTNSEDWRAVEDDGWDVVWIYHSHINEPPVPSPADKTESERHKIPFAIVSWPNEAWDYYIPSGWKADLVGRPFIFGVLDCYTLIQDYYEEKLGITLPYFQREKDWWNKGQNLYMENIDDAGFVVVDDLRMHDVLLIQTKRSPVANHAAVYIGDGDILHHLDDRISLIEPYILGQGYARQVHAILRHKARL